MMSVYLGSLDLFLHNPNPLGGCVLNNPLNFWYLTYDYFFSDQSMDGINAIHLAAMFHAKSLMIIIRLLRSLELLEPMKDIFEACDPHRNQTPLHFSIRCYNSMSSTLLLICGVDIEARDIQGSMTSVVEF